MKNLGIALFFLVVFNFCLVSSYACDRIDPVCVAKTETELLMIQKFDDKTKEFYCEDNGIEYKARLKGRKNIISRYSEKILFWVRKKIYQPMLKFCIDNVALAISIPVAILLITFGAVKGNIINTTFFPHIEGNNIRISMELPAGTPDEITDSTIQVIEENVWKINQQYKQKYDQDKDLITAVSRFIGPNTHQAELSVSFISSEKREWSNIEIANHIRRETGKIKNTDKLEFSTGHSFGKPVVVSLKSNNMKQLNSAKEVLKSRLEQIQELKDIVDDTPPGPREVHLKLKDKAFALGLNYDQVIKQVRTGFFGGLSQRVLRGIDEVKIWVRYEKSERKSLQQLEKMRIRTPDGASYPLNTIADLEIERGIMAINHINGQQVINVEADVISPKVSVTRILNQIDNEIMAGLVEKYPDIQYSFEGQKFESEQTMSSAYKVVPAFLILMFLIMTVALRSIGQASLIFLLIPFGLIGVLWGHFIQGYIVSLMSMFGLIALFGIIVNDSLVLVNTFNDNLRREMKLKEALFKAGISRFRPVLLTTLTTVAGLAPLMFSQSRQAQFLSPMAISVAYGLIFGTLLTLLVLPSLIMLFNRIKVIIYNLFSKDYVQPEETESNIT